MSLPKRWGSVARRGARVVGEEPGYKPEQKPRPPTRPAHSHDPDTLPGTVTEVGPSGRGSETIKRSPRSKASETGPVWRTEPRPLPDDVVDELARFATNRTVKKKPKSAAPQRDLATRLSAAAEAYERDRYGDTLRMTRALLRAAPGSPAVRELNGLACYRLGKWEEAIRHLEIVVESNSDPSQLPVLMDCYRALGRRKRVEDLWTQLKGMSPEVDVLVEGRLVVASTRAESGDLPGAIDLLVSAGAGRALRHPAERHLRQWYVLAGLLEASGDVAGARQILERVVRADPDVADAADRLVSLGRQQRKRPRSQVGGAK